MAVLSITAANVLGSSTATRFSQYKSAAAITAGQLVYLNTSNAWALVDTDGSLGTASTDVRGIAENSAPGAAQPLTVVTADSNFTVGVTSTNGSVIYASVTAGAITIAEVPTTGAKPIVVGIFNSTTTAVINIFATGVVI